MVNVQMRVLAQSLVGVNLISSEPQVLRLSNYARAIKVARGAHSVNN